MSRRLQVRRAVRATLGFLAALAVLPALAAAFDNWDDKTGAWVLKHNDCSDAGTINGTVKCTSNPDWLGNPFPCAPYSRVDTRKLLSSARDVCVSYSGCVRAILVIACPTK